MQFFYAINRQGLGMMLKLQGTDHPGWQIAMIQRLKHLIGQH